METTRIQLEKVGDDKNTTREGWRRQEYNLNLLPKLTALLRRILFNLVIAAIAETILMRICTAEDVILGQGYSHVLETGHLR